MKTKLIVRAEKEGNYLRIYIKAPKQVEDYYKKNLSEEMTSTQWKDENGNGIVFYKSNDNMTRADIDVLYQNGISVFSEFGSGLIYGTSSSKINIALLRAKGIGEGITFCSDKFPTNAVDLEVYVKNLVVALKVLIAERIGKRSVRAMVTYEI